MKNFPFHLSLPCHSISKTRDFYVQTLGARQGRNTTTWLDIDLFGNQITFTKSGDFNFSYKSYKFEDSVLPAFHFGVVVDSSTWNSLYRKLELSAEEISSETNFLSNKKGEHRSFFIADPNGYKVEFKCFKKFADIFAQ
ncbi:MAG: bleomycin resistance protein [Flavobacteriaceae bacterium]|nr:bleomycin resistance protein [Flavobacteriaceae bacterium]